jgi:GxxExxY protein
MQQESPPILLKEEVYAIVGAAMEVHRVLGSGFLEAVYQEALEYELSQRQIAYETQEELGIFYKDRMLEKRYRADLICYDQIIIELKASTGLIGRDTAQLLNYLKASRVRLGLLINFGSRSKLEWKRLIL